MKNSLKLFAFLLVATLLLVACGGGGGDDLLADIEERGTIRISTDPNYAPQSFLNESGEYEGFDIDVAREIAERLGVEVEFVEPVGISSPLGIGADNGT